MWTFPAATSSGSKAFRFHSETKSRRDPAAFKSQNGQFLIQENPPFLAGELPIFSLQTHWIRGVVPLPHTLAATRGQGIRDLWQFAGKSPFFP